MHSRRGWEGFSPAGPNATRWIAEVPQNSPGRSKSAEPRLRSRSVSREPWRDSRQHAFQRLDAGWWEPIGRSSSPPRGRRGLLVSENKFAPDSQCLPPYVGWPTAGPTGDKFLLKARASSLRGHVDWVRWSEETRDVFQRQTQSPKRRPIQRQRPDASWCSNYGVVGPGQSLQWPGGEPPPFPLNDLPSRTGMGGYTPYGVPPAEASSHSHIEGIQDNIFRVVLTGGPCGGKSSSLPRLRSFLEERGFDVHVVPETMSQLRQGGCEMTHQNGKDAFLTFIRAALRLQLRMESAYLQIAKSTKQPSVIIMDRGIMDLGIFLDHYDWEETLASMGLIEANLLARYDLVLHFVTVADGKREYYAQGNTVDDAGIPVIRKASPDVAFANDQKLASIWQNHALVCRLENTGSFADKVRQAIVAIADLVTPAPTRDSVPAIAPALAEEFGRAASSREEPNSATVLARAQQQLRASLLLAAQSKACGVPASMLSTAQFPHHAAVPPPPPFVSAVSFPPPPPLPPPPTSPGAGNHLHALLASAQETEDVFSRYGLSVANISVSLDGSSESPLHSVHAGRSARDEADGSSALARTFNTVAVESNGESGQHLERSMVELEDAMTVVRMKIIEMRTKVNAIKIQ